MTVLRYPPSVNALQKTLGAQLDQGETSSVTLNNATNIQNKPGVFVVNRIDTDGNEKETSLREYVAYTAVSGSTLTGLTRGQGGSSDQDHATGSVVEFVFDVDTFQAVIDALNRLVDESDLSVELHDANDNELVTFTETASAVNQLNVANAATGNNPIIEATGDDTNIGVELKTKGTGDVDITGNSTANVQVAGADPNRTITLMPGALKPTTTSGCASSATVEAATNDIDYDVLDFDASSDEFAFVNFAMPDSWDGGVVQFRVFWTNAGGGSAETVDWTLEGRSLADDDAIDQATGTAVTVTDTWIAQGDMHVSAWSGDVTITGAGAGEYVHLEVGRDVSEDDLTGDARLMAIQIRYKQAQYSD